MFDKSKGLNDIISYKHTGCIIYHFTVVANDFHNSTAVCNFIIIWLYYFVTGTLQILENMVIEVTSPLYIHCTVLF